MNTELLFNKMVMMARKNRELKEIDGGQDWQKELLEWVWDFTHTKELAIPDHPDWYMVKQMTSYVANNMALVNKFTARTLGTELKKLHVCPADKQYRDSIKIQGKAQQCYRITEDAMMRAGRKFRTSYWSEQEEKRQQKELWEDARFIVVITESPQASGRIMNAEVADDASAKFCFGDISACNDPACGLRERCRSVSEKKA